MVQSSRRSWLPAVRFSAPQVVELVQEIRPVQGIALLGNEPRVADQAAQLLFRGAMVRSSRAYDIFLDHDAANVIAAEPQPQLAGFQARRYPGRLDVLYVLEIQARKSQHLQVLHRRGLFLHKA